MQAFFFDPPFVSNFWEVILKEVYLDKIYVPYVESGKKPLCLEIGANAGLVSYYLSQYFDRIIALEPSTEHFENLSKMLEFNKITNVKAIKKAIFTESGKFPFGGPPQNKTMRSLHMATWENGKPIEEVEAISLPDLFEQEKIDHVDFMKVDIEGNETELFSSRSFSAVADKIDMILTEVHAWSGRNNNQLLEALKENGFEVSRIPNQAELVFAKRK